MTHYSSQQEMDAAIAVRPQAKKRLTNKQIAFISVFVAISVTVNAVAARAMGNKLSFAYTIDFMAGYFFGGIAGLLVGGIGDLLGCLLAGYAPNPFILLSSCLLGFIPGMVKKLKVSLPAAIVISYALTLTVCTAFINTYGLWLMYGDGRTFFAYMAVRLTAQAPVIIANIALTFFIMPLFRKVLKAEIFN